MPAVVHVLLAGAAILAVAFIASLLPGGAPTGDLPPLRILAPADGDTTSSEVVLRFSTPARLALDRASGWTADGLHLHAVVNGRELMPAAADIAATAPGTWQWHLPALPHGPVRLHLTWADATHRDLPTPADTLHLHVHPPQ